MLRESCVNLHELTPCREEFFEDQFFVVAVPLKPYYNPVNLEKDGGPCQAERIHPKHRPSKTAAAFCASAKWPGAWEFLRPRCAPGKLWGSSRRSARGAATVSSLSLMCACCNARFFCAGLAVSILLPSSTYSSARELSLLLRRIRFIPGNVSGACERGAAFRWLR